MTKIKFFLKLCSVSILFISLHLKAQEIKWDTWGVPHITGKTEADAYYAFGWAQMKAHGNLILKAYGKARGRSAEYWGGNENLSKDILYQKLNIPNRSKVWFNAQDNNMKELLNSFVAGMNAYCKKHPNKISEELKVVLPIKNTDPLSHLQVSYHISVGAFKMQPQAEQWKSAGSNAWAIGPSKSASGKTILLTQPHPPWLPDYLFFEGHLKAKKLNIYGVSLVGTPTIAMGFNENLGWALTYNQADSMDLIEIDVEDGKYLVNGSWKNLITEKKVVKIKKNNSYTEKVIEVKKSDFGYIINEKKDKALALRLSGLDRPYFMRQFYNMSKACNLNEFETALKELQLPLQNIIYADNKGEIFYLYNGIIPKRPKGVLKDWSKVIPSNKDGALVNEYLSYEELPKFKNPKSGFIANSNNGPWSSTYPFEIFPKDYPTYITERPYKYFRYRSVGSVKMIVNKEKLSFDEVTKLQSSTYAELADRTVPELVSFAEQSKEPILNEASKVLKQWDKTFDTNSRGSVLFTNWFFALSRTKKFEVDFSPANPLNTPNTLTKEAKMLLIKAAKKTKEKYGTLDVSWGDVYEIEYAGKKIKGGLGLGEVGAFNAGFYRPISNNKFALVGGSAYTSVVEFGKRIKARGILSYGNSSQKGSPFNGNQIQLLVDRKLRDIWFYPKEIDKNLCLKERLKK